MTSEGEEWQRRISILPAATLSGPRCSYILYCGANFEVLGDRMRMLFPPCCFIPPHLAGPKIPFQNRSPSCRNGLQTTACTTGVCGTDGFCAANHIQKIIGLEQKQLKTTGNR